MWVVREKAVVLSVGVGGGGFSKNEKVERVFGCYMTIFSWHLMIAIMAKNASSHLTYKDANLTRYILY